MTRELFAWVSDDEGDGVVAAILPDVGATPLVFSTRRMAEKLAPFARAIAAQSGKRLVLRRFVAAEDVEVVEKESAKSEAT